MCLALLVWLFLVQFWRNTSNIHFPETTGSTDAHNLHYNIIIAVNGMHVQANNPIYLLFGHLPQRHTLLTYSVQGLGDVPWHSKNAFQHGTQRLHILIAHRPDTYPKHVSH
jgi:hypothetical protein